MAMKSNGRQKQKPSRMLSRTIRIDEDVWRHLQQRAQGFESVNAVIRRELKLDKLGKSNSKSAAAVSNTKEQ